MPGDNGAYIDPAIERNGRRRFNQATVHTSKPPLKVDYELTAFGKTLIPLLKSIAQWGKETAKTNKRIKVMR